MKTTKKVTIFALCAAMALVMFAGCGDGGKPPVIDFTNDTEWAFITFYISPSELGVLGPDALGDDTFSSGSTMKLGPEAAASNGLYDIECVDEDGDTWIFKRVALKKGSAVTIGMNDNSDPVLTILTGKNETQVKGKIESAASENSEELPARPSKDDPLDMSYEMTGYPGGMSIPYPSTLQVCKEGSNGRYVQFEAYNEPDFFDNIGVDLVKITNYDSYFTSGDAQAKVGLNKIFDAIIQATYSKYYIKSIGSDFYNAGSYYSLVQYIWLSGDYFTEVANTPVRAVMEIRYLGPIGYILVTVTAGDEAVIQRYYDIARNIANAVPIGGGWSTASQGGTSGNYYYPDEWDYDDYYGWDWDSDPWSGYSDYGEDGGGNYYYEDGQWYESNDADW